MLTRSCFTRRGATLLELTVTVVVAGVALGLIAAISVRQQRVIADLEDRSALAAQLSDALAILPIDVAAVSSVSGDIREARDTSLEIRATIATAVACDTSAGRIVLAPPGDDAATYGSVLSPVEAGDTAWVLTPTDSAEEWKAFRVGGVGASAAGDCSPRGPRLGPAARVAVRVAVALDGLLPAERLGAPIRITRPSRYSLYRASDGLWYFGQRDWNNSALRFNGIQPVSGPYLSPAAAGLVFQYADSAGLKFSTPVAETKSIALVRLALRGESRSVARALSIASGKRIDSASRWILLRNRR